MKKNFLLIISLFICSQSSILCSDDTNRNPQNSASEEVDFDDFDNYDQLVIDALDNNVLPEKIEIKEPSRFEILMKKIGIFLFLKPYIFIVTKYRCVKKLIKRCVQKLFGCFSKQETEATTNEQKQ